MNWPYVTVYKPNHGGPGVANATAEASQFNLPDFTDRASSVKHTDFSLRVTRGSRPTFMVSVKWRGELKFGGGYPEMPDDGYMRFAASPEEAPIVWLNGDGPFRFQRWYSETLQIGGADDFKVFLGQQGIGRHSFASFQCHALPNEESILATLMYQDKDGNEHHLDYHGLQTTLGSSEPLKQLGGDAVRKLSGRCDRRSLARRCNFHRTNR